MLLVVYFRVLLGITSLHTLIHSSQELLDHPHYTRPAEFAGMSVPEVLLSGHHENIEKWRYAEALKRTAKHRPDLLQKLELSEEDIAILKAAGLAG